MTELPLQRLLLIVIDALDRLGLPYMIMGGFAVRSWGIPRPTYDLDLAVRVSDEQYPSLLRALEDEGFDVPDEFRGDFRDRVSGMDKIKVTRFEERTVWEADLFIVGGPFLESALARRRARLLESRQVWVTAPEDLLLMKLVAWRRKDQVDAEEILKVTTDLDRPYLTDWARRLDVSDRLEALLREIESS